jgi:hypothetical protein
MQHYELCDTSDIIVEHAKESGSGLHDPEGTTRLEG